MQITKQKSMCSYLNLSRKKIEIYRRHKNIYSDLTSQ